MFCTSWSVALFVSQKRFQQFHISFRFLFQVLAFEIFHVIFDRSIVINKPFLVHVFKLQRLRKLKISLKKWNTASRMKITLLRLIHQKTWYAAPDWTYRFARTWKSDTRHLIGYCVLRPACEPNLFRTFSVGKSQYVYNKYDIQMGFVHSFWLKSVLESTKKRTAANW